MSGFADLVPRATASQGRLGDAPVQGETEGTTWKFSWDQIVDDAGDDIDLTSATIVCKIISTVTGAAADTEVLALTATGGVGTLTVSATSTETANLATGAKNNQPRKCWWYCTVTSGSNKVQFWGPVGSPFNILPNG